MELVDDLDDVVHFALAENVLVELQDSKAVFEVVRRLKVVLWQLVDAVHLRALRCCGGRVALPAGIAGDGQPVGYECAGLHPRQLWLEVL